MFVRKGRMAMKNNAKRVLALAAAGVIALGAAGCGASGGSSGQNASGGAGTNAAAEAGSEQKEFRIFAGVSSLSPDNSEKPLVKQMNEAMGVTIDWDCVSGDSLTEKKNLVLNAGSDLPDALMGADLTDNELITSGANGQFIPLEGYINETVMPNLSAVIQKRPNLLASATMPDGHIYGLPRVSEMGFQYSDGNEYQIGAIPQFTAINTKWLDEAGLKMPETVEELHTALTYFKEHDMLSAVVTGLAVVCAIVGVILIFLIRKNFAENNGDSFKSCVVGWAMIAGGSIGSLSALAGATSIIFDVNGSN